MTGDSAARVRAAILDPAAVFKSPEEVERDDTLSREDKLTILDSWEEDAHELAVAEDESMGGGAPSRLEEIVAARDRLAGAEPAAGAQDKDARKDSGRVRVRRYAKPAREVIHADHELDEAALQLSMQEHPVLPVADADQVVGVVARADLERVTKQQKRDARITARMMMTTDLAFCYLDDDVATARALMDKHGCSHLLVADRNRVLVGTLERDDLPEASPEETQSLQGQPEVVEPREEHGQGVADTIQPGGLDVYAERLTVR